VSLQLDDQTLALQINNGEFAWVDQTLLASRKATKEAARHKKNANTKGETNHDSNSPRSQRNHGANKTATELKDMADLDR
jgi:hypothetical protein